MNRLFSLLLISLFTLVICARILSKPTLDEETLKNLEMESAKHPGYGESDVTFQKSLHHPQNSCVIVHDQDRAGLLIRPHKGPFHSTLRQETPPADVRGSVDSVRLQSRDRQGADFTTGS